MSLLVYLEFSDAEQHAHKFYEVTVHDRQVEIRFGRIGEAGQTQTKSYDTAKQAQAEAEKKIREKLRKGYVQATPVQQPVAPPPPVEPKPLVPPTIPPVTLQKAPIVWQFSSGSQAFGLFVSSEYCWVGNQQGRVFRLDLQGEVMNQYQLPAGVKCIVEDDIWIYVGCDNGNVYDLTGKLMRLAYELDQKVDIYWLDIHDGILAVSDASGGLAKIDPDGELEWTRLSQGKLGWMVRADDAGFYHGHKAGVTFYDRDQGRQLWHYPTEGSVLFGWQEAETLYAGTSGKKIIALDKVTGTLQSEYCCDASVYSCATAEGGRYVFAGDSAASIYCFDRQGQRLWKSKTGCGSALSMQFCHDRLYIVTTEGSLACIDATTIAIQSAQVGNLPQMVSHQAPATVPIATPTKIATTTSTEAHTSQGVIVQCIREEGKLRIRTVSPGYHNDWKVQFPRDIREAGVHYWVEELREARQGQFYRAYGEIKKLI